MDGVDLTAFYAPYAGDGRRNAPYAPRMMVKVLLYAYATGVFSSRGIARKLEEDVAFRVLGAGNFPQHRTLCEFRRRHLSDFKELFVAVVRLARELGLARFGKLSIDGTKVRANASKRKAMSYGRMAKEERRLRGEIEALLAAAGAADAAEDARLGAAVRGDELPAELRRREDRLAAIRAAKSRLEAQQRAADDARGRQIDPVVLRCSRATLKGARSCADTMSRPLGHMFSYLSPEQRVPADHPLRAVRALTDEALQTMSRRFASLYATTGRPSIPPEQLLRALLLQVLYTVRSERLLMEAAAHAQRQPAVPVVRRAEYG